MTNTDIPSSAVTHAGRFHADDVFSSALLKMLRPDIRIHRTFRVPDDFDGLVFDIGGGAFDHHQQGAEVRENGVPYASLGLLWRTYGRRVMERGDPALAEEEARKFDEKFIQPLDEDDNRGTGNLLAGIIGSFNPCWDSDEAPDECFRRAVLFAGVILQNRLNNLFSVQRARALISAALEQAEDKIVVLPRFAPWKTVLESSDAEFIVYPSQRGGYCAQIVPAEEGAEKKTGAFPAAWAGRPAEDLARLSGIPTLNFCHNGRFLIATHTKEDAIRACREAREIAREEKRKETK